MRISKRKKPAAGHGRIAIRESATQERSHEDRRGQDDDRSRRRPAGDHPTEARIAPPRRSPHAAKRTNRGPRFDGMDRVFGKAEDPPSECAGIPVGCGRSRRQATRRDGLGVPVLTPLSRDGRQPGTKAFVDH